MVSVREKQASIKARWSWHKPRGLRWVEVDNKMEGTFKRVPDRQELSAEINEAIVELYSK